MSIWLKLLRKKDYVEIKYSIDNINYQMLRLAYFPPDVQVMVGIVAATPGKKRLTVNFEGFEVQVILLFLHCAPAIMIYWKMEDM